MPTMSLGPKETRGPSTPRERDPLTLVLGGVCGVLVVAVVALGWIVLHPKPVTKVAIAPQMQSAPPGPSPLNQPRTQTPGPVVPQPQPNTYSAPISGFPTATTGGYPTSMPNGGFPSTTPNRPFRGFTGQHPQNAALPTPSPSPSSVPPGNGYLTREQLAAAAQQQLQLQQRQQSLTPSLPVRVPATPSGGVSQPQAPAAVTDSDLEIKATYKIQNSSEFVFDGNVTNIGDAPAAVVEIWGRFSSWTAYPPGTPLNENGIAGFGADKLFDNAFRLQLVETFRRLKPSESRPLKTVVHAYNARDVQGLPQGWRAYFGPYEANLFARVRQ